MSSASSEKPKKKVGFGKRISEGFKSLNLFSSGSKKKTKKGDSSKKKEEEEKKKEEGPWEYASTIIDWSSIDLSDLNAERQFIMVDMFRLIRDSQKRYKYEISDDAVIESDDISSSSLDEAIILTVKRLDAAMERLPRVTGLRDLELAGAGPMIEPDLLIDTYRKYDYRALMQHRVQNPLTDCDKSMMSKLVGFYRESFVSEEMRTQINDELSRMRDTDPVVALDVRPSDSKKGNPKNAEEMAIIIEDKLAMIHDLIDPNLNTMEHRLWIPSEFESESGKSVSGIVNLDSKKYPRLHSGIESVLSQMIPMVSDIIRLKFDVHCPRVKCVVKAMDYILPPKAGYKGNIHREGIGEGIVAVGIYYVHTSEWLNDGGLNLTAAKLELGNENVVIPCRQGSAVVFSNEVYHELMQIQNESETEDAHRMILAFFFIHPLCGPNQVPSNLDMLTNARVSCLSVLRVWMRECMEESDSLDIDWLHNLVANSLAGDVEYRYTSRAEFRKARSEPFPMPRSNRFTRMAEISMPFGRALEGIFPLEDLIAPDDLITNSESVAEDSF